MTRTRQRTETVQRRGKATKRRLQWPRGGGGGRGEREGGRASRRASQDARGWQRGEGGGKVRKSAHSTAGAHALARDLCGLLLAARGIRTFAQLRRRVEVCEALCVV